MLRAAQIVVDEGLAKPILIGRPQVVEQRLQRLGLRVRPGREFDLINPESDPRYRDYWSTYHKLTERKGVTPDFARVEMRRTATLIGAVSIYKGEAEAMLCGVSGAFAMHLHFVDAVIGLQERRVHVALGLRDGRTRGGHLFEMTVRPTVELVLTSYPKAVGREIDPEWGLPLLDA